MKPVFLTERRSVGSPDISSSASQRWCESGVLTTALIGRSRQDLEIAKRSGFARFKVEDHPAIDLATLAIELANTPCGTSEVRDPEVGVFGVVASYVLVIPLAIDGESEHPQFCQGFTWIQTMMRG